MADFFDLFFYHLWGRDLAALGLWSWRAGLPNPPSQAKLRLWSAAFRRGSMAPHALAFAPFGISVLDFPLSAQSKTVPKPSGPHPRRLIL
jgi:hypothetical protein